MRGSALPWLVLGAIAGSADAAPPRLTEPAIRAFTQRQETAWNSRDVRAWAATYAPAAVFVDQARNSQGGITANGSSTLAEAAAQARRFFRRSKVRETSVVTRIEIAPDGRSARVFSHDTSRIETERRPARVLCAESLETLILDHGRILSAGQTDTAVRCPR